MIKKFLIIALSILSFCYVSLAIFFDHTTSIVAFLFFFWIWLIFLSRNVLHISDSQSRLKSALSITSYLSAMSIVVLPIIFILLLSFGFRVLFFGIFSVYFIWAIALFLVGLYITHTILTIKLTFKELETLKYSTVKMLLSIMIYPIGLILFYDSLNKKRKVNFNK